MSEADPSEFAFPGDTVPFLSDLKAHNTRQWFADNKTRYEAAYARPAKVFVELVAEALGGLTGQPMGSKIFRVHRDVRFSKDKTPYNAHIHISFFPSGENTGASHWMFGLDSGRLSLGVGNFGFQGKALQRFRERIAGPDGDALVALSHDLQQAGVRFNEPSLKKIPSGFQVPDEKAGHIRRKALSAWLDIDEPAIVSRPGLVDFCMERFAVIKPVNDWLAEM